jgi:hypothetical protein
MMAGRALAGRPGDLRIFIYYGYRSTRTFLVLRVRGIPKGLHQIQASQEFFKTLGVIGLPKTPWTGDTVDQAPVACENTKKHQ